MCVYVCVPPRDAEREVLCEQAHASLSCNGQHLCRCGSSGQPGSQVLLGLRGRQQALVLLHCSKGSKQTTRGWLLLLLLRAVYALSRQLLLLLRTCWNKALLVGAGCGCCCCQLQRPSPCNACGSCSHQLEHQGVL